MQPSQCVLQHHVHIHAAITMRFASTRSRTQRRNRLTSKRSKPQPPHTGGTFHRWLQPLYTEKHKVSFSGFLPNTSPMQHSCSHHNAFCSIPFITTSLRHHFPSSPLPFVTISHHQHFPSSPLPFVTTSLSHHAPKSPHSLRHHFPMSPHSLRHHFPSSPLPFLTTSLRHIFPRSPLPFVTTLCHSLLFFCDVLLCDVKSHTALHQCQVSQFYLSVTRKTASQLPLITIILQV